ncbi:polynucleotide adenylyltransferase PcnB [Pseudaquabacterium pictum]|uniref:Poly(A) polymerase I n=1 Tax=Pseudaquabacterium pictum TaxID=2315236 RepID=A0A480ATM0_9BURK|nr:poly(A) polymerase I [Rubrivivax pictus]
MIKKFISRLLGKGAATAAAVPQAEAPVAAAAAPRPSAAMAQAPSAPTGGIPTGKRVEVPASEHGIDPKLVDERAINVVRTLQRAGYEAYVVGGAVRDLLVGLRPKDFDVATNATPEQVKGLFRRAFIIGRRFRIVHVIHGRGRDHEVIEVSTFRAYMDNSEATQVEGNEKTSKAALAGSAHAVDASGRVLRDNVWGPQVEDAARRDFTVNAMYYDPESQVVVDYHHGIADVKKKLLRLIGDPLTRYREDPVRIIRAVRFMAKLGFTLEKKTAAPIAETVPLLANVPISRMFDEMVKLLQTGHALASVESLKALGLHRGVFPVLDAVFDESRSTPEEFARQQAFIRQALQDTDRRVGEGKPVAPSFLLACLLWHDVQAGWRKNQAAGEHPAPALQQAIDAVFDARIGDISGRGKLGADMREIWMMQPRLERRQANTALTMIEQPRFRAGFDFLRLRADVGEAPVELAEWWEDFSMGSDDEREALLTAVREAQRGGARKAAPARTAKPAAGADSGASGEDAADDGADDGDEGSEGGEGAAELATGAPARKRRRRRRKPAGAGGASAPADGG